MHISPQESIEQLQFELNDTKGRLDTLSFMARIILDSVKLQDEEAYQALKMACLTYSQDHLAALGEIGEDDIEEQAQLELSCSCISNTRRDLPTNRAVEANLFQSQSDGSMLASRGYAALKLTLLNA